MVEIPSDGVVYVTVTFAKYPGPSAEAEASLDRETWFPFDIAVAPNGPDSYQGKVLVRGPQSSSTDGHLMHGPRAMLWARVTDAPEIIPVPTGTLVLV